jgi:hypothetical protein
MCVEIIIWFMRSKYKDSIFKILLCEIFNLFVHDQGFSELLYFLSALPLDFSINFDEYLQIPGHHMGKRVGVGLQLL